MLRCAVLFRCALFRDVLLLLVGVLCCVGLCIVLCWCDLLFVSVVCYDLFCYVRCDLFGVLCLAVCACCVCCLYGMVL